MVTGRQAAVALVLAALVACQDRPAPAQAPRAPEAPVAARPTASPRTSPLPAPAPQVERDLLRYGEEPSAAAAPVAEEPGSSAGFEAEAPVATPPPLRLVGFVRRPGRLCAALVLGPDGLSVLCPGDSAAGHRLLAADEERGVRLALPDGGERELPAPR